MGLLTGKPAANRSPLIFTLAEIIKATAKTMRQKIAK